VKIWLLGMNHRTAPLEVRERYAASDPGPLLAKLVEGGDLDEAVLVSTCNRIELLATTPQPEAGRLRLRHFFEHELARDGGADADLDEVLYELADREAVGHVLRVASSLDSMVVGEPQILGQMKDAYRQALSGGTCGPVLSRLFQHAFATAKRVRSETRIAERSVSVARVAVELARQIFEDFEDKRALLVGAGDMIEAALQALQRQGLRSVRVANRTASRAQALAEHFGATPHGLDELEALLHSADVVLSCVGGEGPLIHEPQVREALRTRRSRPLFLIDLGVPRNVDPAVNELDAAFLYDIDDLQDVAAANAAQRRNESLRADDIVREEEQRFDGWLVALQAVPTIRHLRARAEAVRQGELGRALGRLGLEPAQREGVERLTRAIVNKLLHAPLARLRADKDREEGLAMLEAARALFGLDDAEPAAGESDEDPDGPAEPE
jgi:glutamyl-tRNA reductase